MGAVSMSQVGTGYCSATHACAKAQGVSSWFLSDSGEYTSGVRSLLIPAEGAVRTTKTASLASNIGSFPKRHAGKGEKWGKPQLKGRRICRVKP